MIKKVGNVKIREVHSASCHCGAVQLSIKLPNGLVKPGRCNCSICRRKGIVVAAVPINDLTIVSGEHFLSLYQFNTKTAKHYFCTRCGIHTHNQRRSNPELYSINIACLDGVNPFDLDDIPTGDGVNHSSDQAPSKLD